MNKRTVNVWTKGRNTDTDPSKINIDQYLAAYNLEIVGSGKYTSLQNINGTTNVKQILNTTDVECPGVFRNKYVIGGAVYNCLTIFTYTSSLFKIWCYNTETTDLYELFEQAIDVDYDADDRVIDAINYPENGTDIIYFTDNYNELRFIKCEIPSPYSANFLSDYDISLLRKGANGLITTSASEGGTLLSGTYQFAYRCLDPVNKRFTKWSTLTNPVHVYSMPDTSTIPVTEPAHAGVGLITTRKITVNVYPSFDESDNLGYIQLAVIENVGAATPTIASLLEITPLSGTPVTYQYKNNSRIGTVSLDDLTVDQAQIEKVKTITIKQNRLFAGNVQYTNLQFDNGNPSVTSGHILTHTDLSFPDLYSSDNASSATLSYWRDEVYRFGVVYTDRNGNKSTVYPLDMSGVTDNQITSGLKDFKFPDRSHSNTYSLFTNGGLIKGIGLNLTIDNHPTWARSFEIVRVARKKNILFQTPLIPMMTINGTGALNNYPTNAVEATSTSTPSGQQYPNAQPMTSGSTLIPKNMFYPELRSILKSVVKTGSGPLVSLKGECYLWGSVADTLPFNYASVFPPANMYGDTTNQFVFTGAEKIDYIDYALLRLNYKQFSSNPTTTPVSNPGNYIDTSVSGSWYAVNDNQYFFDSHWTAKSISASLKNIPVTDYAYFDNFGETTTLAGTSIMDYASFQTQGIKLGYQPNIQRMGVIRLKDTQYDVTKNGVTFAAATLNPFTPGGYIFGSSGLKYDSITHNDYITASGSWSPESFSSAVPIVNVKLGLGDDRYGDLFSQQEYISTGAKWRFTESDVTTLEAGGSLPITLDVYGGDCFISPHLFKICDSTYSVIGQNKYYGVAENDANYVKQWDTIFNYKDTNDSCINIPVAVKNSGQFVQVVLESEYNGTVRDIDNITNVNAGVGIPFYNNTTTEQAVRTPLTYKYNINLSKQNNQKVYFPKVQYSFEQHTFSARVIWSDLKIYNSDQSGFDVVKVADFLDLEEKRYGITKLAIAGDNMYAIQQQGTVYLPVGERQLEATDGGTLAVRTDDVIGRPIVIDAFRGSQHLRGIVETGGIIYIPDNINRNVYALSGEELRPITQDNESAFRSLFANKIAEKSILGIYDSIRHEYWLVDNDANTCEVYNEGGIWVGNYEFTGLSGGVSCNQQIFLIGKSTDLSVHTMYTGAVNQLFGVTVVPRVQISVNPDENFSKTFDNTMFSATERLSSMDFVVQRESSLGDQTGTIDLDKVSIEGNYRVANGRASDKSRLRGLRMLATIKWKNTKSALQAVWSYYRLSSRVINK